MPIVALDLPLKVGSVGTPTVTPEGTGGSQTWGYKIVGVDASGNTTAAGTEGTTAGGNATLDGTNFNRVTWTDPAQAVKVRLYRTTATGGTPATTGLIATLDAGAETFDDTGIAADGSTAPSADTTGEGVAEPCLDKRDKWASVDGTFVGTVEIQARIGSSWVKVGSDATAPAHVEIPETCRGVRAVNTAYTSGTPTASLAYRPDHHDD